ncbi:TetR/AcrR family transcriptional regulator C-terminal domain-containing protein [Cellulomonas sp. NPDC089187]|uniref:TetR/AcrR family transcriptional regulator C-terminal domain-containing protein n=1 Tax=Cellulomonas sp. NPDC089187 TaxID=3154970 RepID=UPI00342EF636
MTTRNLLDRDQIIGAAIALADENGLDAVSMRKVGQAVGVEAMSLYHHIQNKERLLDAMIEAALAETPLATPGPWRDTLRSHAAQTRLMLSRHPWAAALLNSRENPGAVTLARHDALLGALHGDGLPWGTVASAISVVDAYVLGFAQTQQDLPFETPEESASLGAEMLAQLPLSETPHFAQFLTEHVLTPDYDHRAEFDRGLEILLVGLASTF